MANDTKIDKLENDQKLSLTATYDPQQDVNGCSATSMFGPGSWIDLDKFRAMYLESIVATLREKLTGYNEDNAQAVEAIQKCASFDDLKNLLLTDQSVHRTSNVMAVIEGAGNPYRIDNIVMKGDLTINWSAQGIGWGELKIIGQNDGSAEVWAETMSRHFIRSVLLRLADELIIVD